VNKKIIIKYFNEFNKTELPFLQKKEISRNILFFGKKCLKIFLKNFNKKKKMFYKKKKLNRIKLKE